MALGAGGERPGGGESFDEVKLSRDRFVGFAFTLADLVCEVDGKGLITFASGAGRGLTSRATETLVGQKFVELFIDQDRLFVDEVMRGLAKSNRVEPVGVRLRHGREGESAAVMGGFRHPDEARQLWAFTVADRLWGHQVAKLPRDSKTGLLESKAFIQAAKERALAVADGEEPYKLQMIGIEGLAGFRTGNDPATVSDFLRRLGATMRAHSLGGDSAGMLSDNRFALISMAKGDGRELKQATADLVRQYDEDGKLTVTTQGMELDAGGMEEEDSARALVYAITRFAQSRPGESFSINSLSQGAKVYLDEAAGRITKLREATIGGRFDMAFQPIVDLKTRQVKHFEALVRLPDLESPQDLVGFAEQIGMIEDLDLVIVQRVLDEMRMRVFDNIHPHIAVNLSARSLQSGLFVESLRKLCAGYEDVRAQLIFEITETARIEDPVAFDKQVQLLRGDGHKVSLDDLGAGTTSFETLRHLAVDYAKIDGSYVRRATESERNRALLQSLIGACLVLNYEVIAEMVEREDQAKSLQALGVKYGQGHLFGRPVTAKVAFAASTAAAAKTAAGKASPKTPA